MRHHLHKKDGEIPQTYKPIYSFIRSMAENAFSELKFMAYKLMILNGMKKNYVF